VLLVPGVRSISIAERRGHAIVCRANYCTRADRPRRAAPRGFMASARDTSRPIVKPVLAGYRVYLLSQENYRTPEFLTLLERLPMASAKSTAPATPKPEV